MVKKGQMKMQQTAFMLIAVTLLFVLVGLFVLKMAISSNNSQKESLDEENALKLVSRLASSPEFSCGDAFSINFGSCVDFDKVMILKERIEDFSTLWDITGIEIRKIYPESNEICTKENYPTCGILEILPNQKGTDKSNFISLCYRASDEYGSFDKCELALLIVKFSGEENGAI